MSLIEAILLIYKCCQHFEDEKYIYPEGINWKENTKIIWTKAFFRIYPLEPQEVCLCNFYVRYGICQQHIFSSRIMEDQTIKTGTFFWLFYPKEESLFHKNIFDLTINYSWDSLVKITQEILHSHIRYSVHPKSRTHLGSQINPRFLLPLTSPKWSIWGSASLLCQERVWRLPHSACLRSSTLLINYKCA